MRILQGDREGNSYHDNSTQTTSPALWRISCPLHCHTPAAILNTEPQEILKMSSPQPKGPESSSGSTDVSETESTAKPHKQDTRRTQQSPFKVPDNNSILLLSVNEKEDHKEEVRKFLALPIHEKTTHTERMTAKQKKESVGEPEEEKEKMENLKQIKSKTTLLKQMPGRHELKMAIIKQGFSPANTMKDSKHDLISMEQQKAVLELALMTKKSAIVKMDKAIAKEEWQLKLLEKLIERDNLNFEEFLRENEKKSVEARTLFEQEAKSNQEKNAEIKRLNAEIGTLKRELATSEETLTDYKRYKEILFKLFPPEQQEAQKTKALKVNVQSDRDTQNVKSREPEESPSRNGVLSSPGRELPSIRGTRLSSNPTSTGTHQHGPPNHNIHNWFAAHTGLDL
uniref:cilia- and flagella-associated protein 100-like n=1 Tax=Monopterus albus TaxID=43700 RepID=UPI0009B3A89C|nr:cilia- and flagella-associated protein 100-like [Monopterus albus]